MKTNGKIAIKGITLVVGEGKEVKFDSIELEYEASFSIHEMIQALDVIDVIPDKLANAYRKFLEYEKEFGIPEELKQAMSEINNLMKEQQNAPKEAENTGFAVVPQMELSF
jgi:hypothetical protein